MPRPILASIDTAALAHNLQAVTRRLALEMPLAPPRVCAVVKARGYGHGIDAVVRGFAQADALAMIDLEEVVQCRDLGWTRPLLMLEGFFCPADLPVLDHHRVTAAVHCTQQLDMLEASRLHRPLDVFLLLNSGMHRLGFQPAEYPAAFQRARDLQARGIIGELGKMTHFARADDDAATTRAQLACFRQITAGLPGPVSVCNSAATLTPALAAGFGEVPQWLRPGICLYGASPFVATDQTAAHFDLRPAMTLSAELISVHTLPAGESIGYGHIYRADRPKRVGIVACGYADGYPRHAVNGTPVTVAGVRTGLLGRVSMDMLAVDLDPVPDARIGTPVVLWGQGGPSIDEVARSCGTIAHELMTKITVRVPRRVF